MLQSEPRFKGKNLIGQTKAFWKAEEDYRRQWQKDNPGQKYKHDDEEHAEFYKEHLPEYDERDLASAQEAIRQSEIEQRVEERLQKRLAPTLNRIEADRAIREHAPRIAASAEEAVVELVKSVPAFKEILGDAGRLDDDLIDKLAVADEKAVEIVNEEAERLALQVEHLERLHRLGHIEPPNPHLRVKTEGGPIAPYQDILDAAGAMEDKILSLPKAEQIENGKQFITRNDRRLRREEITRSRLPDAEKQRRLTQIDRTTWTLAPEMVRKRLINDSVKRVGKLLGRLAPAKPTSATQQRNGSTDAANKNGATAARNAPSSVAALSTGADTNQGKARVEQANKSELFKSLSW